MTIKIVKCVLSMKIQNLRYLMTKKEEEKGYNEDHHSDRVSVKHGLLYPESWHVLSVV